MCELLVGSTSATSVLLRRRYTAIVRPILLYGNIVWWPFLEKNCYLRILHKIQRRAELCISGALCTTATEALNTILDLQPLDLLAKCWASALRLREAAACTTGSFRSLQYPNKPVIHTTYYRLRSTHRQLRKKIQDLHTHPYRLGKPPTPIRKRREHIRIRLQA